MSFKDKRKYTREVKRILNESLKIPYGTVQCHLVGNYIVVDINVRHRNCKEVQRINLTYHECWALPTEFTFGCAKVQASLIKDGYNQFLEDAHISSF